MEYGYLCIPFPTPPLIGSGSRGLHNMDSQAYASPRDNSSITNRTTKLQPRDILYELADNLSIYINFMCQTTCSKPIVYVHNSYSGNA